jgi:monoamine oxidase
MHDVPVLPREVDVVVVGAGAAGIAATRWLTKNGRRVVAIEARSRLGGRAWTTVASDHNNPIDLGCEWLHCADENAWAKIALETGFTIDETPPVWRHGADTMSVSPCERAEIKRTWAEFQQRLHEAASEPDRAAASLLPPGGQWTAFMNAFSTWANGIELERLSIHDQANYRDTELNWRVLEGYGRLIESRSEGLAVAINTTAIRIAHCGSGLQVETTRGTISSQAAIVTIPTSLLLQGPLLFDPPLPLRKMEAAASLPLGHANKLFLSVQGSLPEFCKDSYIHGSVQQLATGSYQVKPHGWPMIVAYFGGDCARELEQDGIDGMTAFATDELAHAMGSQIRQRLKPIAASAWSVDPWSGGAFSSALPGRANARATLTEPIDGRIFFAGEACSVHHFGTAHGAHDTGIEAAIAVHETLAS